MLLEARGLRKEVQGRVLYTGLDLRLERGQTLAVRGPSGSGKSQLLRQLAGLDSDSAQGVVQAGHITYRDRTFDQWNAFEWRTEVCFVPQQAPRLEGTPADCAARIASFRQQVKRESHDPLVLAGRFGIDRAQWDQAWSELSVGERQRALLAMMLARRPGVVLLDEPTAALDEDSARAVEAELKDLTCVWVTHSTEQATRVAEITLDLSKVNDAD